MIVAMMVLIATPVRSQDPFVKWGETIKGGSSHKFIGKDKISGTSFWWYKRNHETWFAAFDKYSHSIISHKVDYTNTSIKKKVMWRAAMYLHGKIYVIAESADTLYLHKVDANGKVMPGITQIPGSNYKFKKRIIRPNPDSTKIIIARDLVGNNGYSKFHGFTFIDLATLKITKKIVQTHAGKFRQAGWDFYMGEFAVDKLNNVVFETHLCSKDGRIVQYWLLHRDSLSPTEINLPRGQFSPRNMTLRTDHEGNFILAGFYTRNVIPTKRKPQLVGGLAFGHINVNSATIPDLHTTDMLDKVSLENVHSFDDSHQLRSIVKEDGGVILMTEQVFGIGRRSMAATSVHVVSTDKNGSILFNTAVPKRQIVSPSYPQATGNPSMSYSYIFNQTKNELNVIYNEHALNLDTVYIGRSALANSRNAVPVMATVLSDGTMKFKVISNPRLNGIAMRPRWSRQSGEYDAMLYGEKGNGWCIGTLDLSLQDTSVVTFKNDTVTYTNKRLKKIPSRYMTFAGASFGYASVPNNHFNDWLAQYSFTGSSSSRLSLPEVGGMLLFARDHLAGGFEVGGSPRTGSIPYQTTLYAGLTGGYHKAFRGGRHLLLTASFGAGCSTFHFQKTPMGPGNIENATSYTLVNSGLYIGTSAKLFKTTRKIFGAGIDTGIRYHLHRNWDYYNIDIKKVTMNIGHDIPNIQGLSVYVNIPFGLCIDDNSSLQANLRR